MLSNAKPGVRSARSGSAWRSTSALPTIHEYALALLSASGEETLIRGRHAAYFLTLAEQEGAEDWEGQDPQFLNQCGVAQDSGEGAEDGEPGGVWTRGSGRCGDLHPGERRHVAPVWRSTPPWECLADAGHDRSRPMRLSRSARRSRGEPEHSPGTPGPGVDRRRSLSARIDRSPAIGATASSVPSRPSS